MHPEPRGYSQVWLGPALGQQTPPPHFWGKSTAWLPLSLCPVLCSLKIQSTLPMAPSSSPASERGGGLGSWKPRPGKEVALRRPSGTGPLIVYAGWTGRVLWSRWPQEPGAQTPGQRTCTVDAAEGRGSRSDCKG